jgi:hypothetical protein
LGLVLQMEGHVMLHTQSSFFVEGLSSSNRYVEKPGDILRQLINLREIVASPGSRLGLCC